MVLIVLQDVSSGISGMIQACVSLHLISNHCRRRMFLYNFTIDADVFQLNVDASGVVPQISVIMVSPL